MVKNIIFIMQLFKISDISADSYLNICIENEKIVYLMPHIHYKVLLRVCNYVRIDLQ